jgi:hypothetical protein
LAFTGLNGIRRVEPGKRPGIRCATGDTEEVDRLMESFSVADWTRSEKAVD